MKEFPYIKLEIYLPESHLPELQEALRAVDAGHIGRYDACLSYHHVMGTWRPLEGQRHTAAPSESSTVSRRSK